MKTLEIFLDYYKTHGKKIIRYLIAGFSNTIFGLILTNFFYYIFDLSARLSLTISFCITLCTLFLFSKKFTFRTEGNKKKELIGFLILMGANYLSSLFIIPALQLLGIPFFFAQIIFLVTFTIINFLVKNHLIFTHAHKNKKNPHP